MTLKTKQELSAGSVVFKKLNNVPLYALGKHSAYYKWVLPKGLIEKGEDKLSAAVRETEEELNLKVKPISQKPIYVAKYTYLADFKGKIENSRRVAKYQESGGSKSKVEKTVYFFLAEYISGDIKKHGWEMSDAGWFEYAKARKLLAFDDEKKTLEQAYKLIKPNILT